MRVTRDVIYDLLPSYFAGDVSDDTRALVDAYFASDPEFARMATRFQSLIADRQRDVDEAGRAAAETAAREREAFDCARKAAELPTKTRAAALVWGFASLFSFGMAMLTWNERLAWRNPGVLLGVVFGAMALGIFAVSFRITADSWWRGVAGLDDESLKSLGFGVKSGRR